MANVIITKDHDVTIDGQLLTVNYTVKAEMTYIPGKLSGPPEDCYPPDAECNIEEMTINSVTDEDGDLPLTEELKVKASKTIEDEDIVEDQLWEAFDNLPDGPED